MTAHPDKGGSEAKMAAVNEAYEVLSNPGSSLFVATCFAHPFFPLELRQRFDQGDDPNDPMSQQGGPFAQGGHPFAQFFQGTSMYLFLSAILLTLFLQVVDSLVVVDIHSVDRVDSNSSSRLDIDIRRYVDALVCRQDMMDQFRRMTCTHTLHYILQAYISRSLLCIHAVVLILCQCASLAEVTSVTAALSDSPHVENNFFVS